MGLMSDKARLDGAFARLHTAGLLAFKEADQEVAFDPWFQRAYVTEGEAPIRAALKLLTDRDAQDLLLYLISKERHVPLEALTAPFVDVLKPE